MLIMAIAQLVAQIVMALLVAGAAGVGFAVGAGLVHKWLKL